MNVRDLDLEWLRGHKIGLISQEPVLFATSILENIRYGRPGASDSEVVEAAKQANAHEFIMGFEKNYDTVLGERGATVSGGQKQRIAIARALLKNPRILILDEATSALDTQSEQIVQQTLDRIMKGRTVLVIAHRLSTIQKADIIYVVHRGKIIEVSLDGFDEFFQVFETALKVTFRPGKIFIQSNNFEGCPEVLKITFFFRAVIIIL